MMPGFFLWRLSADPVAKTKSINVSHAARQCQRRMPPRRSIVFDDARRPAREWLCAAGLFTSYCQQRGHRPSSGDQQNTEDYETISYADREIKMIFSKRDEVCGRSQGTRDENAYGKIAEQRNFLRSRSYTARQNL
jgi:hypothetical protein